MNYCPCCSDLLLQHLRGSHAYWFCRRCWQEMPMISEKSHSLPEIFPKIPHQLRTKKLISPFYSSSSHSLSGWIGVDTLSV
jgi:hypothetical protein